MQPLAVLVLIVFYWIGNVVIWQVLSALAERSVARACVWLYLQPLKWKLTVNFKE
jgi:hypothetical protein